MAIRRPFVLLHRSVEERFQQVPVTMRLVFGAMAQQRHRLILGKMLQEPQSEFLAVIFDYLVAEIDRPVFAQFLAISAAEFGPRDFPRQKVVPQLLARPEIGHSNIVSVFRQPPAPAARRKNSQTVVLRVDFGMD
jgi:hypothetical protein